jgi:hypothetical protein
MGCSVSCISSSPSKKSHNNDIDKQKSDPFFAPFSHYRNSNKSIIDRNRKESKMNYLVRGTLLLSLFVFMATGCSPKYDYTIHKPVVVYQKPSKQALRRSLQENLGKEYVWAEEGPNAFDCSGLTYYCYGRMNLEIPRISREQAEGGEEVALDALQYGDLVFFDTGKNFTGTVTHVGVYIGDGKFEHASTSTGSVTVTSLDSSRYSERFITARRYLTE